MKQLKEMLLAPIFLMAFCQAHPIEQKSDPTTWLASCLERAQKKYDLPAMAASVVMDGKIDAVAAVGVRKSGTLVKVKAGDKFHIGSIAKSMTATIAAMLIEQEKLDWNTRISEIFPEFKDKMDPAYKDLTLTMLLSHRSGMSANSFPRSDINWRSLPYSPVANRLKYAELVLSEKPVLQPGSKTLYSNRNYALVGAIIERVTKRSWEETITTMLFEPLGMKSAGFGAPGKAKQIDQPYAHYMTNEKQIRTVGPQTIFSDNPEMIWPGGGVHCSAEDLAKFAMLHMGIQPKKRLLSQNSLEILHTSLGENYALGLACLNRDWAGGQALYHNGTNTMNFAEFWIAPKKKFAVCVMTNQGGPDAEKAIAEVSNEVTKRYFNLK